ncbi:tagaturonate epimerase [Geosporobacter subterraneus DSM 17957]|uniref:Tagaturonate/fructuronate epimerase n=1 Tax=Geosporobacter subterraneus DSM 17957 TaxID=1121919 RepID=A0A1M6LF51_9FIRM|nr:tagaturonate epimerase family protein [Geosporobacter subterraneus]SHJ69863.1 tagaturonate epimerase [Geosporobacter subterraneus DSM 17957]
MDIYEKIAAALKDNRHNIQLDGVKIYPQSYVEVDMVKMIMVKAAEKKVILAQGSGPLFQELEGEAYDDYKVCNCSHLNRVVLNKYLPYTKPSAFGKEIATIGLGDRLGIASPGHIQAVKGREIRPILAQQSIRELNLTNRTYRNVLDAACFAVFQEGYKDGFGADGDHLKTEEDIQSALDLGFTMITLDCSEMIDNTIDKLTDTEVEEKYYQLPQSVRERYETRYLDKCFELRNSKICFSKENLMKNVLIYGAAADFIVAIYEKQIKHRDQKIDFEVSIDETVTPTTPEAHYFVAREIYDRQVDINSMAPRFCGEFQKGIDYIGDIHQFEKEFQVHAEIADHFGYKISIHSGSDKFSVFQTIGRYTEGRFHVKTAGTNWLEAVRVVAEKNPNLYRKMHQYALEHFDEARAYYHVTTDIEGIVPLEKVNDHELSQYMNENNARQLLHITYGILLQAKDASGQYLFREDFFYTLEQHEAEYDEALRKHIGRHLEQLGK